MMVLTLKAYFRRLPMSLDQGMRKTVELLRKLSELPAFASGWEADGARLDQDEAAFVGAMTRAQAGEGDDGGYHFALAENARGPSAPFLPMESFLATVVFNSRAGGLYADVEMAKPVATFDTVLGIVRHLNAWSDLQHVSTVPMFYVKYDTPIDTINRVGIGWAGWVPFALTPAQLPEAGYLEPLGQGTFLASQDSYWEITDRAAVKRAPALELKLNALGMLPTRRILFQGTWGQAQ